MAVPLVLDTGAFVALVDRSERKHTECLEVLQNWDGPILTTEAVLTETLSLVGPAWRPRRACIDFFLRGAFHLVAIPPEGLRRIAVLMEQYADIPMDFADATLVTLAEDLDADQIFTLDRRGFSSYRLYERKPFRLLP